MITVGTEEIKEMFTGEMGIKTVAIGDTTVYERPGAYVYITFIRDDEEAE